MDVADLQRILCPPSSSSSIPIPGKVIDHAYRRLLSLINTTKFTELTVEELNGKPTQIEELLTLFTSIDVSNYLMQRIEEFKPYDIIQIIALCVMRDLTSSISDYVVEKPIQDLLIQYILEELLVAKDDESLLPDQLTFMHYISSIYEYTQIPEITKALVIIVCREVESEILDPTRAVVDLDVMVDDSDNGQPTSSLWNSSNRHLLEVTLSVLSNVSKVTTTSATTPSGHQLVAEHSTSSLFRMISQLLHNHREILFLISGVAMPSTQAVDSKHIEEDYDTDEDILGNSPAKSMMTRKADKKQLLPPKNSAALKEYQQDLSQWIESHLQATYSFLVWNMQTYPYLVQRPGLSGRNTGGEGGRGSGYGPDGRAIQSKYDLEMTTENTSIIALDYTEISSMIPSADVNEQFLSITLLHTYFRSISPTLPVPSMGVGSACYPQEFMSSLRTIAASSSHQLPSSSSSSSSSNLDSRAKKRATSSSSVKNNKKMIKPKSSGPNADNIQSSNHRLETCALLVQNLRTVELLRPITLSITMTSLSKSGTLRLLVWFLMHRLEDVRFRTAQIFREILDHPSRQERKPPPPGPTSKAVSGNGRANKIKVADSSSSSSSDSSEPELWVLVSALIEQALVPILEIVSRGISVSVNGEVHQFPELYIRSVATDMLFAITNSLDSKDRNLAPKTDKEKEAAALKQMNPAPSKMVSLRQKMLNTILNTQNPKLRRNVFSSIIFLSARSTDLGSKIWEASRKSNATGPAGGLLREMLEGPLTGRTGKPNDFSEILSILAQIVSDSEVLKELGTENSNANPPKIPSTTLSRKTKLASGIGPTVMVENSNLLSQKSLNELGGKGASLVRMQCPVLSIVEVYSPLLAQLLAESQELEGSGGGGSSRGSSSSSSGSSSNGGNSSEDFQLPGTYDVWQQLFTHMVSLQTGGNSDVGKSLSTSPIEILLEVYEITLQFSMTPDLSKTYQQSIIQRLNFDNLVSVFGYALRYDLARRTNLLSRNGGGRKGNKVGGIKIPDSWSSRSRYDLSLCAACLKFIKEGIDVIFMPSLENPLRGQDCLSLLLECIGTVFLSL